MTPVAPQIAVPFASAAFSTPQQTVSLDVIVTRGTVVESRHRVHAAVVDEHGNTLVAARNQKLSTWWRSCAKPFQVFPMLALGHFEQLGWGQDELALACASHGGEPEHVALAGAMLQRIGLEEGDLACGPHEPLSARGSRLLRESGHRLTRLHNNCSGKHSAMLARAVIEQWPIAGYERREHPVQLSAHESVSAWAGLNTDAVPVAVDGCGVTVFALPLERMALAYARLVSAARDGQAQAERIVSAMTGQPFLVGGSDRFDTLIMQACAGRVICKIGAEGVHTLGLTQRGIGLAVKVEDGTFRAQYPAVLALLDMLGELPSELPEPLRELTGRMVRNTRGETVGELRISALDVGDDTTIAEVNA